jgi:hypothetical protein
VFWQYAVTITGMPDDVFDLSKTYVHLGVGGTALPLHDFSWSRQEIMAYLRKFAAERDERRLMGIVPMAKTWTHWECHTGEEVVVLLSGSCDVIQEIDGQYLTISLRPGQAMINPRGVWHTSDVHEPGQTLFVAAGRLTRYRAREPGR